MIASPIGMITAAPAPIDRAQRDQLPGRGDLASRHGRDAEQGQSGHEDLAAAQLVAELPDGQEQPGPGQSVGRGDPLQLAFRCAELDRERGSAVTTM